MQELLERGWIGNKAGQGYYKREGGEFLHIHFRTFEYGPMDPVTLPGMEELMAMPLDQRLQAALQAKGEIGEYIRLHIPAVVQYAMEVGKEISLGVADFDNVMKWGFGWEQGPFEMVDGIGYENLQPYMTDSPLKEVGKFYVDSRSWDFRSDAHEALAKDERTMSAEDLPVTQSGEGFNVRRFADGHFAFQFRTKMNALNPSLLQGLQRHIESHPRARVTLLGDSRAFSAGFNLQLLLDAAEQQRFEDVRGWLAQLQGVAQALQSVPSVAAVEGFCLGGGLELALHCSRAIFHPEAFIGLPEALVGLLPAGGGTTLVRRLTQGDPKRMANAAITIALGKKVSAAAAEGTPYFRETDALLINPDFMVHSALNLAPTAATPPTWEPAPPPLGAMIESEIEAARSKGELTEYGAYIAEQIKHIFTKPTSEVQALEMEVEAFLRLLGNALTQNRIKHMIETGKPLNN